MLDQLPVRRGHFLLESGHHGNLWFDLELLCHLPERILPFAKEVAASLDKHEVEVVCGPLVEGAFLALMVAAQTGLPFTYTQPQQEGDADELYPVSYRLPEALRPRVRGKRVAIINDVINVGSAVRGTFADLQLCEARPVVITALAALTPWVKRFAETNRLGLEVFSSLESEVWTPTACPMCVRGEPLTTPG